MHEINLRINGYRVFANGREMDPKRPILLEFRKLLPEEEWNSFAAITFFPVRGASEWGNFIDHLYGVTEEVKSMLPSTGNVSVPTLITDDCNAEVEEAFHRLTLTTSCPGKPHLLKYSYYPKWKADVPIYRGVNGFMLLTPESEKTVLLHRDQGIDKFAKALSGLGLLICVLAVFWRRKSAVA